MLRIGLTGTIGSGKTVVAGMFEKLGGAVIDTDRISRELTCKNSPALKSIGEHFSTDILLHSGELNRTKLREIIFKNLSEKKWLENYLHPLILEKMNKTAKQINAPYVIFVIPLLIETHCESYVDRICVVDANKEIKVKRVCERDQMSPDSVHVILKTQALCEDQLKKADDIIENNGDLVSLKKQVEKLHHLYLTLSATG